MDWFIESIEPQDDLIMGSVWEIVMTNTRTGQMFISKKTDEQIIKAIYGRRNFLKED